MSTQSLSHNNDQASHGFQRRMWSEFAQRVSVSAIAIVVPDPTRSAQASNLPSRHRGLTWWNWASTLASCRRGLRHTHRYP